MAITPRKLTNFSGVMKFLSTFLASCSFAKGTDLTLSSNAGTADARAVKVTTEALTTAHTAAATLVITMSGVVAGDMAMISMVGGTNTQGVPVFNAVCTTNTVTITLRNNAIAANAFNGTFIFNLVVLKQ